MAFTETTSIQEIIILPLESNVQVKRRTVVSKDGQEISSKEVYQLYSSDNAEAVAILEAAGAKGVGDAAAAAAAKAAATAALADKEAQIAALEMQIVALTPAPITDPREAAKAARAAAVAAIKVTTAAGNTFDGDELSQGRMARAIIALSTGLAPSVNWVLADNTVIQATKNELTEALVLAGQAQAAIWVLA